MRMIECACCAKHAATLAARDAEIAKLKDKAIRFDLDQIGIESRERDVIELVEARAEIEQLKECVEHYSNAALDRLHEIERLKEELETSNAYKRVWEQLAKDFHGLLAAIDEATEQK